MQIREPETSRPCRPVEPAPGVVVAIASAGRREQLTRTVRHLGDLLDPPDLVIVSVPSEADADRSALESLSVPVEILTGPRGSSAQRNTALDAAKRAGIVFFMDDDYLVAEDAIAVLRNLFARNADVVVATGEVLADGMHGPGYSHGEALEILAAAPEVPADAAPRDVYSAYGCNMAARGETLRAHDIRFDTDLPFYGWLEDLDFSRRAARHGRLVHDRRLRGVHLAQKAGRTSGRRLGYSQIANPIYLVRKGSYDWRRAARLMAGNILANAGKSLRPEPYIDRRGRLVGNLIALGDVVRGRCTPKRIMSL